MKIEEINELIDRRRRERPFHKKITEAVRRIVRNCAKLINQDHIRTLILKMSRIAKVKRFIYIVKWKEHSIYVITIHYDNMKITNTGFAPGSQFEKYIVDNVRTQYYNYLTDAIDERINELIGKTIETI